MILTNPFILLIATLSSSTQAQDPKPENDSPSIAMSKSIISRAQGLLTSSSDRSAILQAGFVQKTFDRLLQTYPNDTSSPLIAEYLTKSVNSVVNSVLNATLDTTAYPLDRLSSGSGLIQQYKVTKNETYRSAFEALRRSIDLQPRNNEGGLWYWIYPHWSYLDGMYSFAPFLSS
ncbi:Nn.00g009520.m01.CDS01 [Neocucurbitaria sp. VM-36]